MHSTRSLAPPAPSALFREGFRDMAPLAAGYIPFALVIGTAVSESAIDNLAGWAGSFLIAAGAAHLAVVEMVDNGAAPLAVIATAVVINARLALYSAGMTQWFADEPAHRRPLLAYFLIDPTYLLSTNRFETDDPGPCARRWYYLGAGSILFTIWVGSQTVAVLIGNRIPDRIQLEGAGPLIIAGLLAVSVRNRAAARTAAGVGGFVAIVFAGLPFSTAILLAILVGSGVGARFVGGGS